MNPVHESTSKTGDENDMLSPMGKNRKMFRDVSNTGKTLFCGCEK
jgi:hypothetical protein